MTNKDLKRMLRETLQLEEEYYDFCVECLTEIFDQDSKLAITFFDDNLNDYENWGCIQSLQVIKHKIKQYKEDREKLIPQQKED